MAPFARLSVRLVVALALVACGKAGSDREAARSDAGPPKLTGATVPGGRAVVSADAAADATAGTSDVVNMSTFGATVEDTGEDRGAAVVRVAPGSQAASVLRPGDVITAVALVRVRSADELARYLERAKGGVVLLTVEREGTSRYVVLTTG